MSKNRLNIIAHRGFWKSNAERNTGVAFDRANFAGYGIELDLRDCQGEIVVAHDVNEEVRLSLKDLSPTLKGNKKTLALNIKSDGLGLLLKDFIKNCTCETCFCFDMSIPEMVTYKNEGIPFYSHISDVQKTPPLSDCDECKGIWIDCFGALWYETADLLSIQRRYNLPFCIVSEELHGRSIVSQWEILKRYLAQSDYPCSLCTDYPEEANDYFNR